MRNANYVAARKLPKEVECTALFLEKMNKLFNVLNSRYVQSNVNAISRAPEWHSGLRHCISEVSLQTGSIPGCITTGRDWESHRAAHNWPSVVRVWPG